MVFDALKKFFGWTGNGSSGSNGSGPESPGAGMIPCEDALSRIYEFLDGELDGVTHEQVERHFEICERCYPALAMEKNFKEAVHRALETNRTPPELKERVLELIHQGGESF